MSFTVGKIILGINIITLNLNSCKTPDQIQVSATKCANTEVITLVYAGKVSLEVTRKGIVFQTK